MKHFQDELPAFLSRIHPAGQSIYICILLLVISGLGCLPLIKVPVSVSGHGIIRPDQACTEIFSPVSGMVEKVHHRQGDHVVSEAPLIRISAHRSGQKISSLRTKKKLIQQEIRDLVGLLNEPMKQPTGQGYLKEYTEYIKQYDYQQLISTKAMREFDRQRGLYESNMISEMQYDDLQFSMQKSRHELLAYDSRIKNRWQSALTERKNRLLDIEAELGSLEDELEMHTLYANTNGYLLEFNELLPGSVVQSGQRIGLLSPDARLVAEFYLPSSDMGFLREEMNVCLHMDAFPSTEWSCLNATITQISADCLLQDHQPYYRIRCSLESVTLYRNDGQHANIMKGMGFQAQCLVCERSLLQLITDKTTDWMLPTEGKKQMLAQP